MMYLNDIIQWTGSLPALGSPLSDTERILWWMKPHELLARCEFLSKSKIETTSTSGWEAVMNAEGRDEVSSDYVGVEEQEVEPETTPEKA